MEPFEAQSTPRTRKRWLYRPQSRAPGWAFDVEGLRLSSLASIAVVLVEGYLKRYYYPQLGLPPAIVEPRWLIFFPRIMEFCFFVALMAFAANLINGLMAPDPARTWGRLDPGRRLDPIGLGLFVVAICLLLVWY